MTRRHLLILAAAVLALSAFSLAGCGKKTKTVRTPTGTATVTEEGRGKGKTTKVETETKEGKVTVESGQKAPTEKELGVPVYPGSTVEGSVSWTSTGAGEGYGKATGATLTTKDDVDKVAEFYKSKVPKASVTFQGEVGGMKHAQIGVGKEGDKDFIWIMIAEDPDTHNTRITISRGQKGG
jgi:hypothetical protein